MTTKKKSKVQIVRQETRFGEMTIRVSDECILVEIPGYSTYDAASGVDLPVIDIDLAESGPQILVWGDINVQDPTHRVRIEDTAKHEARLPDSEWDVIGVLNDYARKRSAR